VDQARPEALRELQDDLLGFLGQGTPYEGVEISERELGEIELGEPLRDGVLEVETLLALARRFKVDAVLYTAVTRERIYSPLALGLQAELVAVDTGQVVWAADVQLDAADEPVREAVRLYYRRRHGETEGGGGWEVSLIAPRRFARFGAWQLVQML
jgi:hypothetical protein